MFIPGPVPAQWNDPCGFPETTGKVVSLLSQSSDAGEVDFVQAKCPHDMSSLYCLHIQADFLSELKKLDQPYVTFGRNGFGL